ncbi:MAG: RNA polymerase sigma factor [Patescibacteria group bacterium]|nr:RNA polymerase sigma factor [Patescibacteria group bacterium]
MEQEIDGQLIKKYLKGDENSLRLLYERHIPSVYNFIARLCPSETDVDDIVQEAFVKAWKNLKKFKPEASFRPWLFAIAKNVLLDKIKKNKTSVFSLDENDQEPIELEDPRPLADAWLDEQDSNARVSEILDTLSPAERATVVLHAMEGMTFREIGEILGQPMETVKTRYRRAIARLAVDLDRQKLPISS